MKKITDSYTSLLSAISLMGESLTEVPSEVSYPGCRIWSPISRSGNNRREESSRRHAKKKVAYLSKRAQRKKVK